MNLQEVNYIRAGVRQRDKEEPFWIEWALFHKDQVPEDDYEIIGLLDCYRVYRGPGQFFAHEACIRRVGKRVLVQQFCGLDI